MQPTDAAYKTPTLNNKSPHQSQILSPTASTIAVTATTVVSKKTIRILEMGSKSSASLALFLALNLLFFALVTACGSCPSPKPKPKPKPTPTPTPSPSKGSCPRDALKLGVCAKLLGSLLNATVGTPPKTPCCTLIQGLADLEAAVCLCTAIKANVLGINLNIPLSLSLLLNVCTKNVPKGFQCA